MGLNNMQLKRFVLFLIFIHETAMAASMCVPPNTYVAVLDPGPDGLTSTYESDGTFTVTFDYVTSGLNSVTSQDVSGVSSCNEIPGTLNSTDGHISASSSDVGQYCWCSVNKPLITEWAYVHEYSTDTDCASSCTALCATSIRTNSTLRTALYGSVW